LPLVSEARENQGIAKRTPNAKSTVLVAVGRCFSAPGANGYKGYRLLVGRVEDDSGQVEILCAHAVTPPDEKNKAGNSVQPSHV
jgi:hypothetical protein